MRAQSQDTMNADEVAAASVRVLANAAKALLVVDKELIRINRLLKSPVGTDGQVCDDVRLMLVALSRFSGAYASEIKQRNQQLKDMGIEAS